MSSRLLKIKSWIRPQIKALEPYEPEATGPRIRLDANETPWDVPEAIKQSIWQQQGREPWNRYPDQACVRLRQALAEMEQVRADQILAGNGSDEIIRDLLLTFGGPGTQVVLPVPTFAMYGLLAQITGTRVKEIELASDWSLEVGRMQKALAQARSRLAFIASPNNPTGRAYPLEQLEEILRKTDCLVVVDEAYRWFSGQSLLSRLGQYPNLVLLNTLSKACSLAGLRVGYLIAHPEIIRILNRVRLPYNLDSFSQGAAEKIIRQRSLWQAAASRVAQAREDFAAELRQRPGIIVYPSQANFILIRTRAARRIKASLARQGIAVRGFSRSARLSQCLRITIGTPEENQACLAGLDQAL